MLYKVVLTFQSLVDEALVSSVWPSVQIKAIEQYIHVVLFVMLYKEVLTFKSVDETLVCTIQMKATEQYFHVVRM